MRKLVALFLMVLLAVQIIAIPIYAQTQYKTVDRHIHVLGGSTIAEVVVKNEITMIGFDSLAFYLGADIGMKSGMKYISRNNHKIAIAAGTTTAMLDDKQVTMPIASFEKDGDLYIPLSFVVQSLGFMVYWHVPNQTIYIQDPRYYQEALKVVQNSLESVKSRSSVATNFINYTNLLTCQEMVQEDFSLKLKVF